MIVMIYIGVLAIFVFMKNASTQSLREFPPTINCDGQRRALGGNNNFKKFAELDKEPTLNKYGTGVYQCYCESVSSLATLLD